MIAHVAAAGEGRGRVLLWFGCASQASRSAIDAAVLLARAYQSEIESLFVEDTQFFDLAEYPFARTISGVQGWEALPREGLEHTFRYVGAALQRQVADVASKAEIPYRSRVVRDDPLHAVATACAENGPWNVVTLAEAFEAGDERRLENIFIGVPGTTGVVVSGRLARERARRRPESVQPGPVVALIEEFARLGPMMKAAERLALATGGGIRLVLVSDRLDELDSMEGHARLLFGEGVLPAVQSVLAPHGDSVPVAEAVRQYEASFVLAQYGGQVVPVGSSLRALTSAIACPIFLVR
jgi:hypothetical protein